MSAEVKRPAVWSKDLGIDTLDPDGWRADGQPWGLAITEEDFRRRAAMSTMREVATPAPLDPSKVRVGDTVTLENGDTSVRGPVAHIEKALPMDVVLGFSIPSVGWRYIAPGVVAQQEHGVWTLTDHQPAPEPGPEWKPGTIGTAGTVRGLGYTGPVVRTDEHLLPWWTPSRVDGAHYHGEETVTDFVPDEPRPLPTRGDLARVMHDDYLPNGEPRLGRTHREILADAVLAHLRGESR